MGELLQPFPQTPAYRKLKKALKRYGEDKLRREQRAALKQLSSLRLICMGRTSTSPQVEFVMDVEDGQRQEIEEFLGKILGDVVVFVRDGQRQDLRLSKVDNRYVLGGDQIGNIINSNQNIDRGGIELWGYPKDDIPVFVVTFGVINR